MRLMPKKKFSGFSLKTSVIICTILAAVSITLLLFVMGISHSRNYSDLFPLLVSLFIATLATFSFMIVFIVVPSLIVDQSIDMAENVEDLGRCSSRPYPFVQKATGLITKFIESSVREHEAEYLKKQAEISELQSQINPHFLYNTLEAIRSQCLVNEVPDVAQMAKSLAMFFRYSIDTKRALVSIADELKNVSNYFMIQQYRFDNKFSLDIVLEDDDESVLDCMIPKLTIQPIIENSIYHGLETKMTEGRIEIRITRTHSRIIIIISDNGSGMDEEQLTRLNDALSSGVSGRADSGDRGTGIALPNVHQRIKLYFGREYGLVIRSVEGTGTDVEVTLPVHYNGENDETRNPPHGVRQ